MGMKREQKRQEAEQRNTNWNSMSYSDQLKELDKRPGKSEKQRAKIWAKIEKFNAETP
jgi:hypothetical protein